MIRFIEKYVATILTHMISIKSVNKLFNFVWIKITNYSISQLEHYHITNFTDA